jgi:uncharacterized protein (TIGR02147 family)
MKADPIFQAKTYKIAISEVISETRFGRGARTRLAEYLGVQPSFVSRVLAGDQDFSAEHIVRVGGFLELDQDELDYLVLLHHRDRAGAKELRGHYQRQIDRIFERRTQVKNQIKADRREISDADALRYYGAWYHAAVHMYLRIPGADLKSISDSLALSPAKVKESIRLLEELGMIVSERGRWKVIDQRLHNSNDSLGLRAHHMNWRQASIRAWDEGTSEDMFYSLVMSTDRSGIARVKKILLDAIQSVDPVIGPSEDREVHALTLDLFCVGSIRTSS